MSAQFRPLAASAVVAVALLAGCGGPATFVSADPPPATTASAWFAAGVPAVRDALARAMASEGLTLDSTGGTTLLIGSKHAVPYIDDETTTPVAGPLPLYVLEATLARPKETHVRLVLLVRDDGRPNVPFEWEYPSDLIRGVLDRARDHLREPRARYDVPPRYRAPRWRRSARPKP